MKFESVTFITRHYPPSSNINGESVCDLVEYLQNNYGISCNIVHIDQYIGKGVSKRIPLGNSVKVKNYFGHTKSKAIRFLKMFFDGYLLIKKAKKIENSLFVVTTSPPLLPFWSSLLLGKKRKQVLWSLDLFPEFFLAKGMISKKNLIYKYLLKKTYASQPEFIIALGKEQGTYLANECFKKDIPQILLPCGVLEDSVKGDIPYWYDPSKIILGYCGNVDFAHNPSFITDLIDTIDPEKHTLILALYGSKSQKVLEYAKGKKGVEIVETVPRNQLSYIAIHTVSLIPEFTHIAVPSKAVSAVTMGRAILFCGDERSDNWSMFQKAGWFIKDDVNKAANIQNFFANLTHEEVKKMHANAEEISLNLKKTVRNSYSYIGNFLTLNA